MKNFQSPSSATLYLVFLSLCVGLFLGAYIEREKSMISVHKTVQRNNVKDYEYFFSNFMSNPHEYGVYIRDLTGGRPPISIIVGKQDSILNISSLIWK